MPHVTKKLFTSQEIADSLIGSTSWISTVRENFCEVKEMQKP